MSAISVRWLSISWGAVIFETNYGLMQHSHFEIKNKLLNALDEDYNVVDMATVCEIVTILEKTPITPKILEDTRLGKVINEFRRKTENEVLAKRAKDLVRRWRHLMLKDGGSIEKSPSFHQNGGGSSNSTLTNNSDPITDCSSSSVVSYSEPTKRRRSNKLAGFCNNNSNNVSSNDDDSQSCNMDRENYNISNNNFSNNNNNSSNNRRHRNHNNNNSSSSHNSHNSDDFSSNRLWDNGSADVTILDHHQELSPPHHHGPETDDAVPKTHVSNKRMRKRAADDPMDDYYREPRAKKSKLNGVSNRLQFTKTRKNGDNFDNYVVSNNNNNNHQITNCTPITTTTTTTMVEEEPDRTIDDTVMVEKKTHRRHHRRSNRYEDSSSHSSSRYDVGHSRNEENTDNNWYEDNGHHHSQYEDIGGGHNSQYEDLDNSRYEDDDVDIDSSRNEDIDNNSVLLTAAISPVISVTNNNNNNNNNNNVPAAFSSTVPYNTTADIDIVVEDSGGVPTTSAASSVTETSSRKKRSSKKKENKKYHYDNIIKEKLLVMAKTGKVKTTKELVNNLKHQESSTITTIDETSLSRLPPSSTSTAAAVHQEVQYDKHDDDSRQIPNPDQDSSITRDVVEQHLLPASSVSAITSNECLQQLIPSTGSSNNRSKDHRHRHKRVVQKSDDPIENEIVTLLSKLPPLDVDSIVWSSDEDGEHDEVLAEFEINAKADLLNSDEAVEGVTGNFDHRDMRFKEWQDVVARKTANDEFITVLPYTVVD